MYFATGAVVIPAEGDAEELIKARGHNLSKLSLRGCDFSRRCLINADFSGSDCTGCDFSNTDLSLAKFEGANLYKCNFANAILYVTNFEKCNLTRANFEGACIYGIYFGDDVNATYASFKNIKYEKNRRYLLDPGHSISPNKQLQFGSQLDVSSVCETDFMVHVRNPV